MIMPLTALAQIGPQIPPSAGGQVPPTIPSSEAPSSNVFEFGLGMGATYDSHMFISALNGASSDIQYSVTPRFSLRKSVPRLLLNVSYSPGVEISQHGQYPNTFSNAFDGGLTYLLTDRTSFAAHQGYTISTNPFNSPGSPIGPLGQATFLPGYKLTSLISTANLSHQFSALDVIGIGGSFADSKYNNNRQGQPPINLIQSRIASGNMFYTHQTSPRNSIGFQYQGEALEFPQQNARTFTHTFSVLDMITFSPQIRLTLYGGPDYAITSNQVIFSFGGILIQIPLKQDSWSGAGGAVFSYAGERTALTGEFSRGISEGGGFLGAVSMTSGRMDLVERLTKTLDLKMNGTGAVSHLISGSSSTAPQLLNYGGGISFNRTLGRYTALRFFYQRNNQSASNFAAFFGNHDIGGISLDFHVLRPLGR